MGSSLIRAKLLMIKNILLGIRKEPTLKVIFIALMSLLLSLGLFSVLYFGLRYLEVSTPFGPFLTSKAISFFFMALLTMLIFSSIINSYSILYHSKENDYLFSLPLTHKEIFSHRFLESILYTSWAFILISLPLVLSYGLIKHYGIHLYSLCTPLFLSFILIPVAVGCLVTLILVRVFPMGRGKGILIGMMVLLVPIIIFLFEYQKIDIGTESYPFMARIFEALSFASSPYLPNYWLTMGMEEAGQGNPTEYLYYLLLLGSNGLMAVYLCLSLASKFYYPGWCQFRDSTSVRRYLTGERVFVLLERLFFMIPDRWRTLLIKDIKLFFRDPTQWGQLLLFLGLILIYISNLRDTRHYLHTPLFKHLIILLNLGGTGFVLTTLTTRFVFPLFSLEGMRFWIIGLAPFRMSGLIWEKFIISTFPCIIITQIFFILSNLILKTPVPIFIISSLTILLMSISMVALSTGLGVVFSNFKADNPARIVSGLGGTINAVAGLLYVVMVVGFEGLPIFLYLTGRIPISIYLIEMGLGLLAVFLLSLAFTIIPLRLAFRAIREMEF